MSETPIGDDIMGPEVVEFDGRDDDGTDDVVEGTGEVAEPELGEAPDAVDDPAEAEDGAAEDENEDPGEAEPDDAPIVLTSPYHIPGEGNQDVNEVPDSPDAAPAE